MVIKACGQTLTAEKAAPNERADNQTTQQGKPYRVYGKVESHSKQTARKAELSLWVEDEAKSESIPVMGR